ncbi:hypothetical protein MYAM1_003212 [Malassezia yamatoensis]|uniref:Centromere protein H C-terminal domain-containing protein n=1 Tax=Malassezia yamatoensis TaxID=253288 RepID=A0AAJ5YZM5_9BASI|nr:hypothetical protein MYAM1_003212 [Malassezia yamatoensis]
MTSLDPKKTQLHALERACAVRRVILNSTESSFTLINQLQASEPLAHALDNQSMPKSDKDARSLLRKRDDLAMQILNTDQQLRDTIQEGYKLEADIQSVRQRAFQSLSNRSPPQTTTENNASKAKRELLHGVVSSLALHGKTPWYENPRLTDLVLSMDDP